MPATDRDLDAQSVGDGRIPPALSTLEADGGRDRVDVRQAAPKHLWLGRHNLRSVPWRSGLAGFVHLVAIGSNP